MLPWEPGQVWKEAALTTFWQCRRLTRLPILDVSEAPVNVALFDETDIPRQQGNNPYVALARKWRPASFPEIVGQEHVVRALQNSMTVGRAHHAYLLTGTRGVGKTTIARILAKTFSCPKATGGNSCNECETCVEIDMGSHPDILEMDAASHTKVDNMREILESAGYMPSSGAYRIFIIDEVHMLSTSAFNAMLKTLEEPPPHVKFILATTDPQKLPVTVLSRCLQFNLKRIQPDMISERLAHILDEEKTSYETEALKLVAEQSGGSLRDALSLLDQVIAHGNGKATKESVQDIAGLADADNVEKILEAITSANYQELHATVEQLHVNGISFDNLIARLATRLYQIALKRVMPDQQSGKDNNHLETLTTQQAHVLYEIALNARRSLPYGPDPRIAVEMALLRMAWYVDEHPDAPGTQGTSPVSNVTSNNQTEQLPVDKTVPISSSGRNGKEGKPSSHDMPVNIAPESPFKSLPNSNETWTQLVEKMHLGTGKSNANKCSFNSAGPEDCISLLYNGLHDPVPPKAGPIQGELSRIYSRSIRVEIVNGESESLSPRQQAKHASAKEKEMLFESVNSNPLVNLLLESFPDASIVKDSVRKTKSNH